MSKRALILTLAMVVLATLIVAIQPAGAAPGPLTVTKVGKGHGLVVSDAQPGITCGATCSATFPVDTPVTLTATATAGSTFIGWEGDCSGTGTCVVTMTDAHSVTARFDFTYRPDAWIRLCGLSTWCTINGGDHPWKGKDVYNTNGRRQKIGVKMEDGEGVRFWMTFVNEGIFADTFTLQGCKGTKKFKVNKVTLGFTKGPKAGTELINDEFKNGTATWDLGPASAGDKIEITLNIIAPTTAEGVTYLCPMTITSQNDPEMQDTVVAKMTTY